MKFAANSSPFYMRTIKKDDIFCDFIFRDNFATGIISSLDYHFHSFFELFTVTKGTMHLMAEDRDLWLETGSVCILPPQTIHYVFESSDAFFVGFRFSFSPNPQASEARFLNRFQKSFGALREPAVIRNTAIYSNFLFTAAAVFHENPFDHAIEELLFMAVDQASYTIVQEKPTVEPLPPSKHFIAAYIEEFMNINYSGKAKIEDLAVLLGLSVRQTQRIIARLFHTTFSELLLKKRLTVARFLLQKTELSIEEIAFQTGFYDQSHFHRQFTAALGLTPAKYRKEFHS